MDKLDLRNIGFEKMKGFFPPTDIQTHISSYLAMTYKTVAKSNLME